MVVVGVVMVMGVSLTVSEAGYARSQDDVARDLWTMLQVTAGRQAGRTGRAVSRTTIDSCADGICLSLCV